MSDKKHMDDVIDSKIKSIGFDPKTGDASQVHPFDYKLSNRAIFKDISQIYRLRPEEKLPVTQSRFPLIIWGLSCLGKTLDGLTTYYGLKLGLGESNKTIAWMINVFGVKTGLVYNVLLSCIAMGAPSFFYYLVSSRMAKQTFKGFAIIVFLLTFYAVIHNMRLILGVGL